MERRTHDDRWSEIDAIFQEALDLEAVDRDAFLERRCAGDPPLREAVAALLAADLHASSFLGASAEALAPRDFAEAVLSRDPVPLADRTGERVGPFRVVRQLGRGGMAGVYLAERVDGDFSQKVAIKFIRPGLDTQDFILRFRAERRILSSLEHPNIARLIDGGTTARGLPYLALEYVEGVPITDYCTERGCSIEQRLELFIQVARAVQYAHANLVVHRDIKPSNILVTAAGEVKLLDFGIAKLLDPTAAAAEAFLTRTGLRPLTPEYASPEQVRGDAITTASDVYQLGVLLFRLLTGERPYDVAGTGPALESAITSTQPRAPSEVLGSGAAPAPGAPVPSLSPGRLRRRLRGDLDTIVLKALRKEPTRRYNTAQEMAEDVRRHLDGLPITARRESHWYRASKFLRRNAWVTPVTVGGLALAGLYVLTLSQHARDLEEERNVARDVQRAFVSFFVAPDSGDIGLGEGRRNQTVLEAILEGTDRVRRDLADRPAARAEVFGAMADVLWDLDEQVPAYALVREALEIERSLYGDLSPQVHESLLRVGQLSPDGDSARAALAERIALSEALHGPAAAEVAVSLDALADRDLRDGRLEDAAEHLSAAIDIYRAANTPQPRKLAWALGNLSETLAALGRPEEAVAAGKEGYDVATEELGRQHSETALLGGKLAKALTAAGRYAEARPLYETSLAVMDAERGRTHSTTLSTRNNYAVLLGAMGDATTAESIYRQLLADNRALYGDVHPEVGASLQNLAAAVKSQGRYEEAEALSARAYDIFVETRGRGHFQTAFPLLTIAELRLLRRDYAGAESSARTALDILSDALPAGHFATAVAQCRLGEALAQQRNGAAARPLLEAGAQTLANEGRPDLEAYRRSCVSALAML